MEYEIICNQYNSYAINIDKINWKILKNKQNLNINVKFCIRDNKKIIKIIKKIEKVKKG